MSKNVAVVILNYNGRDLLKTFLPSVLRFSEEAEIYVADNHSTDDSLSVLRNEFPQVKVISNKANYGFARGYNEALAAVSAEYYVLLNSDVEVTENWLEPLISLLHSNPRIAAVQPKIKAYRDKAKLEYAGAAGGYLDRFGFPFCRGRIFEDTENDVQQYDDERPVFWASGACMAIKSSVYLELQGFDDHFFAHMEEIDLCWRMQHAGYEIYYTFRSTVYHLGGATLNKSNPRKTYLNFRNNLLMLYKNAPGFPLLFLPKLIFDGVAGLHFLMKGEASNCWAIVKAHYYFYTHFWKHRRTPNRIRSTNIYPGSIVTAAFIKGKKKFSDLNWLR